MPFLNNTDCYMYFMGFFMTNYLQANTLKNFLEELSYWDGWMGGEQSLSRIGYKHKLANQHLKLFTLINSLFIYSWIELILLKIYM